jgi:hypothetical protein
MVPMITQEQEAILAAHLNTMGEVGSGYSRQETLNLATYYAVSTYGFEKKTAST